MANFKVADLKLADKGKLRIEWAESRMPVLMALREKYKDSKPLKGHRIAGCLHVTKETAVLIRTLRAAGAEVSWSGCNPLSTQDDVAAALAAEGTSIYAWHGLNKDEFYWCIEQTLEFKPTLTLDDGADLIFTVHTKHPELARTIVGGTEETTTGVHRLRAMAADGKLLYPVIAVNDTETKWDFDNVYGTGQSSLDGILRASSVLLAGKTFVVAGYGHCGRGVAMRARAWAPTSSSPRSSRPPALKATLEGFRVMPMDEAAKIGDIFITATGMKDIIVGRHFDVDEGRRAGLQHRPLRLRDQPRRPRGARQGQARDPRRQRGVHAEGRAPHLRARPGPPRQPGRRRGPSVRGHGHVVRQPVPRRCCKLAQGRQDAREDRSTSCRRSRTRRSRASSWRRWAWRSTSSPPSRSRTRTTTPPGRSAQRL